MVDMLYSILGSNEVFVTLELVYVRGTEDLEYVTSYLLICKIPVVYGLYHDFGTDIPVHILRTVSSVFAFITLV
jgi:hypothetical protein